MRRTRLDHGRSVRGFTLLEMIVTMVIAAIVLGTTLFLAYPVQQAGDVTTRAELTDMADNALQRIGRDVRLALPNSVRVTNSGSVFFLEFVPVRTGARYRIDSTGAGCGTGTDELAFNAADACFRSIGTIPNDTTVTAGDFVVLNNYGTGFSGQNAYETAAPSPNRAQVAAVTGANTVTLAASGTFDRKLHDSPGRRFFIVTTPVSYVCDPGAKTVTRYAGYGFSATQPTSFGTGTSALVATDVSACTFDYSANVAPQVGLLTLRLTLTKSVSTGSENVSRYHAVHVNNVP